MDLTPWHGQAGVTEKNKNTFFYLTYKFITVLAAVFFFFFLPIAMLAPLGYVSNSIHTISEDFSRNCISTQLQFNMQHLRCTNYKKVQRKCWQIYVRLAFYYANNYLSKLNK